MGLLDQVLGAVLSKGGAQGGLGGLGDLLGGSPRGSSTGGGANLLVTLLPLVLTMLQQRGGAGGGLGGLLQQLQAAGLGQHAASWVGSGENMPISPEQLAQALGPEQMSALAQQAGVSEHEASGGLASLLPELVNQLTPAGQVPPDHQFDTALTDLQRSLGI